MTWWHRLLRRRRMEEQLEKELRFHIEEHTADLIARGHDPGTALRQARLALGGPEQVKEKCRDARGTRWLEDLGQDLRYALRTLRQKPGFAAVALCTLAFGSGATTAMFTVVNSVLLKPLAFREPERLVALREHSENFGDTWGFAYPSFLDCQRESRTLEIAGWTDGGGTITAPGEPEYVDSRRISAELFSVLGVSLFEGRAFLPEEDRPGAAPVIVISYGLWRRRFGGSPGAVGRRLVLDGQPYTVIGIARPDFRLSGELAEEADVFVPLGQGTDPRMQNRAAHIIRVLARLRPGVGTREVAIELDRIARHRAEQYPRFDAGRSIVALPLRQELVGAVRPTLWLLLGAVSLILLMACVNVASLLLARAVSRERELVMRMALGAGPGRLVRQCLAESALLGLCGGALGVMLAAFAIRPLVAFWPGSLPRAGEVYLDGRVLLFTLAVSLVSSLLFGLAPAWRVRRRDLHTRARTVIGSQRLHSAYVGSQVALAVVLLVAAGILGRTMLRLSSLDPGLNVRNLLTARVALSQNAFANSAETRAAWQDVLDRARRVPGVQSVALADIVPMRQGENTLGYWNTPAIPPPNEQLFALASTVTPDHLKTTGIPLRQGRFFNEHDRMDSEPVIVIDDLLAQHAFGGKDPVGQRLWVPAMGRAPLLVVGVVGHVRHWGLAGDDQSRVRDQIYYPFAQVPDQLMHFFSSVMSIVIRTNREPSMVVESLRREQRGAGSDQVLYGVRTMEQLASASLARQRFLLVLFGVFAGLALLLACVGIYGVLAYLTSQRVPEIGVRMALGATAGDVVRMVLRQSLGMIFVGAIVGTVAALVAGRLLERLVAGVRQTEPLTVAAMISVLVASALVASFLPARRASRIDPVKALRQD